MNKVLNDIEKELQDIKEVANKDLESNIRALEEVKEIIDQAEEERAIAFKDGDLPKYKKISNEQSESKITKVYLEGQINQLNNNKLIDKEVYQEKSQRIKEELDRVNKLKAKEIVDINNKLKDIGKELADTLNEGNRILEILQRDIYKEGNLKNEYKYWEIQNTCNIINNLPIMEEVENYVGGSK